jgi:hypothetical protein
MLNFPELFEVEFSFLVAEPLVISGVFVEVLFLYEL